MRVSVAAAFLLFAVACGGGDSVAPKTSEPPPTTPPTPPPRVPARIVIVSGDAQTAVAGRAVPLVLTVNVQDAQGVALQSVSVTFAVESGGGQLATLNAATDANGNAGAGPWTLGAAGGTNVVTATVASLPSVRFRAQALLTRVLIDSATVPASGGTLRFDGAGDPLNGLSITVPAGSFSAPTKWSVRADSTVSVSLPTGVRQAGPVLIVSNGGTLADSVLTMSVPIPSLASEALAPFFVDPVTKKLEAVPLVDRTATFATLATRHFSNARTSTGIKLANARLANSTRAAFGDVMVVWVKADLSAMQGVIPTSFRPGTDDWEFVNTGSYLNPRGDCEGMSISAMYYHFFVKPSIGIGLFGRFTTQPLNLWGNVQGRRLAASVQFDYRLQIAPAVDQTAALRAAALARGGTITQWTPGWIALTMKMTGQPILIALRRTGGGHAVVAYGATVTGNRVDVMFADPNHPGVDRSMTFNDGALAPVSLALNASASPTMYTEALALGVSAEVPYDQLDTRWQEFQAGHAGSTRYLPGSQWIYRNAYSDTWAALRDTLRTANPEFSAIFECPSCRFPNPFLLPASLQTAYLYTEDGTKSVGDDSTFYPKPVTLTAGAQRFLVTGHPMGYDGTFAVGFFDVRKLTVLYHPLAVLPLSAGATVDVPTRFQLSHGGLAVAGSTIQWRVTSGTQVLFELTQAADTFAYAFPSSSPHLVRAILRDRDGQIVGLDSLAAIAHYAWRVTSLTRTGTEPLNPGVAGTLLQSWNQFAVYLDRLEAKPSDGLIYLSDDRSNAHFEFLPPNYTGPVGYFVNGGFDTLVGRPSSICSYCSIAFTGTSTTGALDGVAGVSHPGFPSAIFSLRNEIHATRAGTELRGTISFGMGASGGTRTYTFVARATGA